MKLTKDAPDSYLDEAITTTNLGKEVKDNKLYLTMSKSEHYLTEVETYPKVLAAGLSTQIFSGNSGYTYFTRLFFYGKIKLTSKTVIIPGLQVENNTFSCKFKIYRYDETTGKLLNIASTKTESAKEMALDSIKEYEEGSTTPVLVDETVMDGTNNIYVIGVYSGSSNINLIGTGDLSNSGAGNTPLSEQFSPVYLSFKCNGQTENTISSDKINSSYQTFSVKLKNKE